MANNSNACTCKSCPGPSCNCGCQPPKAERRAGCQCGEACNCGDTCSCKA